MNVDNIVMNESVTDENIVSSFDMGGNEVSPSSHQGGMTRGWLGGVLTEGERCQRLERMLMRAQKKRRAKEEKTERIQAIIDKNMLSKQVDVNFDDLSHTSNPIMELQEEEQKCLRRDYSIKSNFQQDNKSLFLSVNISDENNDDDDHSIISVLTAPSITGVIRSEKERGNHYSPQSMNSSPHKVSSSLDREIISSNRPVRGWLFGAPLSEQQLKVRAEAKKLRTELKLANEQRLLQIKNDCEKKVSDAIIAQYIDAHGFPPRPDEIDGLIQSKHNDGDTGNNVNRRHSSIYKKTLRDTERKEIRKAKKELKAEAKEKWKSLAETRASVRAIETQQRKEKVLTQKMQSGGGGIVNRRDMYMKYVNDNFKREYGRDPQPGEAEQDLLNKVELEKQKLNDELIILRQVKQRARELRRNPCAEFDVFPHSSTHTEEAVNNNIDNTTAAILTAAAPGREEKRKKSLNRSIQDVSSTNDDVYFSDNNDEDNDVDIEDRASEMGISSFESGVVLRSNSRQVTSSPKQQRNSSLSHKEEVMTKVKDTTSYPPVARKTDASFLSNTDEQNEAVTMLAASSRSSDSQLHMKVGMSIADKSNLKKNQSVSQIIDSSGDGGSKRSDKGSSSGDGNRKLNTHLVKKVNSDMVLPPEVMHYMQQKQLLEKFRLKLSPVANELASKAAASGFIIDDSVLSRYLIMSNGYLSGSSLSTMSLVGSEFENSTKKQRQKKTKQGRGGLQKNVQEHASHDVNTITGGGENSTAMNSSSQENKNGKCAAELLQFSVNWRMENRIGKLDKELLLQCARARQMHVNGFDRDGRAIVIYTPTTESACPVELSVLWNVFNLDFALKLGAAGKGGRKVSQYTFIVDFAKCGTVPPLKTVRASMEVLGKHYPGRAGHVLLVHGGTMVTWICKALRPLTPPSQREKMKVISRKEERNGAMTELISPSQLETRFHGGLNTYQFDPEEYLASYEPVNDEDYIHDISSYLNGVAKEVSSGSHRSHYKKKEDKGLPGEEGEGERGVVHDKQASVENSRSAHTRQQVQDLTARTTVLTSSAQSTCLPHSPIRNLDTNNHFGLENNHMEKKSIIDGEGNGDGENGGVKQGFLPISQKKSGVATSHSPTKPKKTKKSGFGIKI